AEDGIRDGHVTGVQTCALPILIVQFVGPNYSLDISTMISQYHVGAVLLFTVNNNIVDKAQLKGLIQQMQSNSSIPMVVAIDQERSEERRVGKECRVRVSA